MRNILKEKNGARHYKNVCPNNTEKWGAHYTLFVSILHSLHKDKQIVQQISLQLIQSLEKMPQCMLQ